MTAETKQQIAKAHNKAVAELTRIFELQGLNEHTAFNHACRVVIDAQCVVDVSLRPFVSGGRWIVGRCAGWDRICFADDAKVAAAPRTSPE